MDTVEIHGKQYQLALRLDRFAAWLVDVAIIVPYGLLQIYVDEDSPTLLFAFRNWTVSTPEDWKAVILFYYLIIDGLPNGQSIGKRVIKIQVINETTGAPCTVGVSILRNFVTTLIPLIDLIFVFGKSRQRLGDKIAKTRVVKTEGWR